MTKFTHRTSDGRKAFLLDVESNSEQYPIIGVVESKGNPDKFYTLFYAKSLKTCEDFPSEDDLFEYDPAHDLKLDQPIWVRDTLNKRWLVRHFCKYEHGLLYCWGDGKTSYTTTDKTIWKEWSAENPTK